MINANKIIRNILGTQKRKVRQNIFTSIKHQRFTDKELIKILQDLAKELGETPKEKDINQYGVSSGTYEYRFGGWNKALEIAGLPIRNIYIHRRKIN